MGPSDVKEWAELLGLAPGVVVVGWILAHEAKKLALRLIDAIHAIAEAIAVRSRS